MCWSARPDRKNVCIPDITKLCVSLSPKRQHSQDKRSCFSESVSQRERELCSACGTRKITESGRGKGKETPAQRGLPPAMRVYLASFPEAASARGRLVQPEILGPRPGTTGGGSWYCCLLCPQHSKPRPPPPPNHLLKEPAFEWGM